MSNRSLRPLDSEISARFVLAIGDLLVQLKKPACEEQAELMEQLDGIAATSERSSVANPIIFYQICQATQAEDLPTMKDLSEALHMPKATMTRIVDQWVKEGYAKRVYDPDDRRVIRIALTDHGQQMRSVMLDYAEKRASSVLSYLTEEEQRTLVRLLTKIVYR